MADEKDRVVLGSAVVATVEAGAKAAAVERTAVEVVAVAADRARERRRTVVVARPSMIACFFLNFLPNLEWIAVPLSFQVM